MPTRSHLSEEGEREDRSDQETLHRLEARHRALVGQRHELIVQMRTLSGEQRELYERRRAPQADVERLYDEHGKLGKRLATLRSARDDARKKVEAAVIARRELLLSIGPSEPARPDQIRREIADLELRQQTRALPIDEENALIARLRQRTAELKKAEAQAALVAEHANRRKAADAAIVAARADVERIGQEMDAARRERDGKMSEVRAKLEAAGGVVAEMRAKGKARSELMGQIDKVGREIMALEREGKDVFQRLKARRDEARKLLRSFAPPRERVPAEVVATAADRRFEELMKRGKVTLGG